MEELGRQERKGRKGSSAYCVMMNVSVSAMFY